MKRPFQIQIKYTFLVYPHSIAESRSVLPDLPVAAAGGGGDLPQPRHVQVVSADLAGLHGGLGLGLELDTMPSSSSCH